MILSLVPCSEREIPLIEKKSGRYSSDELKNLLKKPFVRVYLFKNEFNNILGYSVIWIFPPEAELHYIEIFPEFRGKGLGKFFLKDLLNFLPSLGVKKIFLEVSETNRVAYSLYKRLGFKELGKRKNYYANGEDAILMEKFLSGQQVE